MTCHGSDCSSSEDFIQVKISNSTNDVKTETYGFFNIGKPRVWQKKTIRFDSRNWSLQFIDLTVTMSRAGNSKGTIH